MTQRFDWRGAFSGCGDGATPEQRRAVRDAIVQWNGDWNWDTEDGYILRLEDENCDGIWDIDYDDSEDLRGYLPNDFIHYMDMLFLGKAKPKKPTVIGHATKLPLPGSRP